MILLLFVLYDKTQIKSPVLLPTNTCGKRFLTVCRDYFPNRLLVHITSNIKYSQTRKKAEKERERQMYSNMRNGRRRKA